ncbi:MAG TPA: DUF72 domain-containing protein [Thermoanaerobaculia bacterium]|nr:DUF72 domain-containing protein [Thermoanaerobaculia bacterium]HUM29831.1 DUF72 domain-containing protein [Thermoanaerobaculia bacterium]HXK68106.1 DUF72 domain-containing protein [Thermoanaerobaculia bacterium]
MVRIGTAGWSYKDWEGIVYPSQSGEALKILSTLFDTLEINVTFYRPPTLRMSKRWIEETDHNPGFHFTMKASRTWTHGGSSPEATGSYLAFIRELTAAGKFGAILFQYPWSFFDSRDHRDQILRAVDPFRPYPIVIEVRHRSFEDPSFLTFLTEENLGFANIDQPLLGKALRPSSLVTSKLGYVRFHGRNYKHWIRHDEPWQRYDYLYRLDELRQWKSRIDEIVKSAEETYVVMNNHYKGQAVVNGMELNSLYGKPSSSIPEGLRDQYMERMSALS